jgi:predicted MFS family arabinose efflux permease
MRIVDPVVPQLAQEFGRTIPQTAVIATAFSLAYALAQPVLGPLGDTFGKARTIVFCLIGVAATLALSAMTFGFSELTAVRIATGIFGGGVIPLCLAAIGDRFPMVERQIALSRFLVIVTIGQMSGAFLSGVVSERLGWRASFMMACVVAMLAAALAALVLKPRADAKREAFALPQVIARYRSVFANPKTVPLYLLVCLEGMSLFGAFPYVAAHLAEHDANAGPTEAGIVLAAFGCGGMIYGLIVRWLVGRMGAGGMARFGALACGACLVLFALPLPWWTSAVLFLVMGTCLWMLHNTFQTQATELSPTARGSSVALFASAFFLGNATGVFVVGAISRLIGLAATFAALGLAIAVIGLVTPRLLQLQTRPT